MIAHSAPNEGFSDSQEVALILREVNFLLWLGGTMGFKSIPNFGGILLRMMMMRVLWMFRLAFRLHRRCISWDLQREQIWQLQLQAFVVLQELFARPWLEAWSFIDFKVKILDQEDLLKAFRSIRHLVTAALWGRRGSTGDILLQGFELRSNSLVNLFHFKKKSIYLLLRETLVETQRAGYENVMGLGNGGPLFIEESLVIVEH